MKLLIDNNLSQKLSTYLEPAYSDITHVKDINLHKTDDFSIWKYARDHELIIVTKDSDFNDLSFIHGFPPFIIWLKIGNCTTNQISMILNTNSDEIFKTIKSNKAGVIEIEGYEKSL